MDAHVDDGASACPEAGVVKGVALQGRQEAYFVHELDTVGGPTFGHGARTEEGEAGGNVDGGNLPDAGLGPVVCVPVLDVVAQGGVMDRRG